MQGTQRLGFPEDGGARTSGEPDIPDIGTYQEIVDDLFPLKSRAWRQKTAANAADALWTVARRNFVLKNSTRPMLRKLKAMGLRMAIVSNHHHPPALAEHLSALRVAQYFSKVYASADVGLRKPDPQFFEMCLGQMRIRPEQAIFVGDSLEYDIEGVKEAGIRTVLITGTGPAPTAPRRDQSRL
ncbi:MAG TPA: HAD-IA family hydrolase [Nitrososphaerales archaeon]|nr:HAD-IA family hydrolase [Nitrososphaerales archaeon]